ncbi:glycosyltransferase [Flavobacteriaceae bacterium]|nr:glycosyltransferase [Flavobacteriaceae bacterium]
MIKVLVFIDWFTPAFKAGGPIQSISNLVKHLGKDMDISIVTSDRDLGDKEGFSSVPLNVWFNLDGARIIYLEPKNQNKKKYKDILQEQAYDSIYFNSLFSVKFTLLPLWIVRKSKAKLILAPRGMLGSGALNIKKKRKKFFLKTFQAYGIAKKITWHATAESEVEEIKKHFGNQLDVRLAPNFSGKLPAKTVSKQKDVDQLNLFFLSRIAEKKNLKGAISFLQQVPDKYKIRFTIIGPIGESDYWQECQKMKEKLPSSIKTQYLGAVQNANLVNHLNQQHFLILPTFHENFGHVIMESFQNGCPVIISDQTPWRNLEEKGIGWDISLNKPKQFVQVIEKATAMSQSEYQKMSQASYDFAKYFTEDPEVLEANRKLFDLT